MQPRETRIIDTPLGNKVEIKTYLTQGERGQVQRILAGDNRGDQEPTQAALLDASQLALKLAVVSLNGDSNDPSTKIINDLPTTEYDVIISDVLDLVKADFQKAK